MRACMPYIGTEHELSLRAVYIHRHCFVRNCGIKRYCRVSLAVHMVEFTG